MNTLSLNIKAGLAKSPTAQDEFQTIPGLISCAGVTRRWGYCLMHKIQSGMNLPPWKQCSQQTKLDVKFYYWYTLQPKKILTIMLNLRTSPTKRFVIMSKHLSKVIQSTGLSMKIISMHHIHPEMFAVHATPKRTTSSSSIHNDITCCQRFHHGQCTWAKIATQHDSETDLH